MTSQICKLPLIFVVAFLTGAVVGPLCSPALAQTQQADSRQRQMAKAEKCPVCKTEMVVVPILIGLPSKEMIRQVELGRALLGGCAGNPNKPEQAFVCLKCRKWKTKEMKYWQPLPKEFGTDASTAMNSAKSAPKPQ